MHLLHIHPAASWALLNGCGLNKAYAYVSGASNPHTLGLSLIEVSVYRLAPAQPGLLHDTHA